MDGYLTFVSVVGEYRAADIIQQQELDRVYRAAKIGCQWGRNGLRDALLQGAYLTENKVLKELLLKALEATRGML